MTVKRPTAITVLFVAMQACSNGASSSQGPSDGAGPPADLSAQSMVNDASSMDLSSSTAEAFSFVVVGCNRVEKADVSAANPSTANLEQLNRTFTEVAALQPPPKFFFFAGDMVYGYKDATILQSELQAWLALYLASPLPALGVELVPLPGNHEVQAKSGSTKLAYAAAETMWTSVMASYIRGANGPAAGGPDGLQTDQSKLSYSFDYAGTHFVVLNTDPVGADWTVPAKWVATDVATAHAQGAKHIFAIGHKPAYPSPLSGEGGLSMFPAIRDTFWNALEANHAEAMLAAHNHLWYKTQPNKTWQIVAGNGGSLLESGVTGADAYYGFTLVKVDPTGAVTITSYGRDVPSGGYVDPAPASQYPLTIRDTVDGTWH